MARISIKNIAQSLGVSNATVSLVLNGKEKEGRIGKEMAEKIRTKAKELQYEPNNLARSLRVGRSQTIGLIVADISNSFFSNLAFHIQEHAEKFGYTVFITNTNEDVVKMEEMINILKSRQVDGFIIVPTENGCEHIAQLVNLGIPTVLLDRYYPELNTSHVLIDNYISAQKASTYLLEQGCRNIALLTYKNTLHHITERTRGYSEALEKAGIHTPRIIREVSYSNLEGDVAKAINEIVECDIDGIFFATNSICVSAIKSLRESNPDYLKKIKIISFDQSEIFEFLDFPVPYVMQPIPEMGRKSVEILIELIEAGNQSEVTTCYMPTKIIYK